EILSTMNENKKILYFNNDKIKKEAEGRKSSFNKIKFSPKDKGKIKKKKPFGPKPVKTEVYNYRYKFNEDMY
ncbi:MAG: hypothetical protein MJ252_27775, partial [archaeon]|nr:hypothetical protein [archaeon]